MGFRWALARRPNYFFFFFAGFFAAFFFAMVITSFRKACVRELMTAL